MPEQQFHKAKRQIEILGLCILNPLQYVLDVPYLAVFFGVEEITIKRDLRELRNMGLQIHSAGKKGIYIENLNDTLKLKEYLLMYVGLCYSKNIFDRSTSLLIEKKKNLALAEIVTLQICVDKCRKAKIEYQSHEKTYEEREIYPILVFHSDGSWRVLSQEGDPVKQFHVDKIRNVRITDESFSRMPVLKFEQLFKHSFGSWIGVDSYDIKIKFSNLWGKRLKDRHFASNQKFIEQPDGTFLFTATVNSLNEVVSWILSKGEGCEVLEPVKLKEKVIKTAFECLANYQSRDKK